MENKQKLMINLFSLLFILITSCTDRDSQNSISTNQTADNYSNQTDSINGKPIKYYLDNKNCSQIAKDYYNRKFIPTDNDSTTALLNLSIIDDTILRPFYFWCLNRIIDEADGALMEYVGVPARKFIEKYPNEYFNYVKTKRIIKNNWITSINYSGYYENETSENKIKIKKQFASNTLKNCINCNTTLKNEINILAEECYGK
jgi:hypothetical protein